MLEQRAHERQRDQRADAVADREPGAIDQLPHGAGRRAERRRDLHVRLALQRGAHERLPLGVGELADRVDRPPELVVGEHDVRGLRDALEVVGELAVRAVVPFRVQRPVADDRVEPGFQVHLSGRFAQRVPRAHEALLDDVLGVRGPVGGSEGDEAGPVTAHDFLERGLAALASERHQAVIGLRMENRSR